MREAYTQKDIEIGQRIKMARSVSGITRDEPAEKIGITFLAEIECGRVGASTDSLRIDSFHEHKEAAHDLVFFVVQRPNFYLRRLRPSAHRLRPLKDCGLSVFIFP